MWTILVCAASVPVLPHVLAWRNCEVWRQLALIALASGEELHSHPLNTNCSNGSHNKAAGVFYVRFEQLTFMSSLFSVLMSKLWLLSHRLCACSRLLLLWPLANHCYWVTFFFFKVANVSLIV